MCNANTESEQVSVLNNLPSLLENFDVTLDEKLILAGDFNLFLNSKLDAKGGKPAVKEKSWAKTYSVKRVIWSLWHMENWKSCHEYFHI